MTGTRAGEFRYLVKHGLSQFSLSSDTRSKDQLEVEVDRLGSHRVGVSLKSSRDRLVQLDLAHQLGVHGDRLELTVTNLSAAATSGLETAIVAGFGGLDLMPASPTTAKVSAEYTAAGQTLKKGIDVPITKGVRIDLSRLQVDASIGITAIDRVGGPAVGPVRTV
jgi:hypothetical protein